MSEAITAILMTFGTVSLTITVAVIMAHIVIKIKKIINKQTKIKCLCRHEYTIDFVWQTRSGDYTRYNLECRKCKKEKSIDIYKGRLFKSDLIKEVANSE